MGFDFAFHPGSTRRLPLIAPESCAIIGVRELIATRSTYIGLDPFRIRGQRLRRARCLIERGSPGELNA